MMSQALIAATFAQVQKGMAKGPLHLQESQTGEVNCKAVELHKAESVFPNPHKNESAPQKCSQMEEYENEMRLTAPSTPTELPLLVCKPQVFVDVLYASCTGCLTHSHLSRYDSTTPPPLIPPGVSLKQSQTNSSLHNLIHLCLYIEGEPGHSMTSLLRPW